MSYAPMLGNLRLKVDVQISHGAFIKLLKVLLSVKNFQQEHVCEECIDGITRRSGSLTTCVYHILSLFSVCKCLGDWLFLC